jgi:hypothetical protein
MASATATTTTFGRELFEVPIAKRYAGVTAERVQLRVRQAGRDPHQRPGAIGDRCRVDPRHGFCKAFDGRGRIVDTDVVLHECLLACARCTVWTDAECGPRGP